ncbi:MAG: hypothetical protein ACOH12_08565 [Parvibaculaceae bacterium]
MKFAVGGFVGGILGLAWMVLPSDAPRDVGAHVRKKYSEPSTAVVSSGQCVVPVCTDVDLGDSYLRYYSGGIAREPLEYVPKGECACEHIQVVQTVNSEISLRFYPEKGSKATALGLSVAPIKCAESVSAARASRETTYEKFTRLRDAYDLVQGFRWRDDSFSTFDVYREKQTYALGLRRYMFVPKSGAIFVGDHQYPVAFETPYGLFDKPSNEREEKSNLKLSIGVEVRTSECVKIEGLFSSTKAFSGGWMETLENGVSTIVTTRLFHKQHSD